MRHHEETIEDFTARAARPEVIGVVVVGSVARGDERTDSDVDVYLVSPMRRTPTPRERAGSPS